MRSPVTSRSAGPASAPRAASTAPAGWTLLAALFSLGAGCAESAPSGPAPPRPPGAPANPSLPPPTLAGPVARYQRVSPARYGSDAYVLSLGADSAFVIVFADASSSGGWSGRYARTDSVLVFHYNARSAAGELGARGTLRGDTLLVRYNLVMQLTDFEDGVYVRSRGTP